MADKSFNVDQYASWGAGVVWNDSSGTPIDLTGYSARMQLSSPSGGVLLTSGDGIVITPATGQLDINLSAEQTGALTEPRYQYDLIVEDGTGVVTRLLQGYMFVSEGMTE